MTDYSNASHGGLLGEVDMKGDWEGGRKRKEGENRKRVSEYLPRVQPLSLLLPPPPPPFPFAPAKLFFELSKIMFCI